MDPEGVSGVATGVGDNRYNDRLTDLSAPVMEARKAHERDLLRRLREIDRGHLTGQDVVSYDLALAGAEQDVAMQRFPAGKIQLGGEWLPYYEWMPLSPMGGVHVDIPALPRLAPLRNTKDYDDFLARLAVVPMQLDQVIGLMKRAMAAGWMPPAVPMRKVLRQIEQQCVIDVTQSPLYKPFEDFPEGIAAPDRSRLSAGSRKAISEAVIPALKDLHKFVSETYLPACRQDIAASGLPGGPEYYRAQIRRLTTTDLSPQQIHEIGEREVARIRGAMEDVITVDGGVNGPFARLELLGHRRRGDRALAFGQHDFEMGDEPGSARFAVLGGREVENTAEQGGGPGAVKQPVRRHRVGRFEKVATLGVPQVDRKQASCAPALQRLLAPMLTDLRVGVKSHFPFGLLRAEWFRPRAIS
jgi:uncharacterized protein (DUF885 family)